MDALVKERNRKLAKKVISGLGRRNMTGYFCETGKEALEKALELIPDGASIGWGGSMSVSQIGLREAVLTGPYRILNRDLARTPQERKAIECAIFGADIFLCSSNAITEDGILVNLDGNSNRVSAISYGPDKVIMIVGMNKVAPNTETAVARVRNTAAPCNAQRFQIDTPCKVAGSCADCLSPDTICCQMLITRFSRHKGRIHVILVNESLGF